MKHFKGKVAAITGASSGIGRALAMQLAREGAELALSDVVEDGLAETVERCRELAKITGRGKISHAKVDVAEREAVHAWADSVVEDHGRVHMIFNNAGVALASTLEGVGYPDFEWIMNINFWGVVHGTKAFLPHLRAAGEGHIINTSSVFGLISVPGNGTYNATKFAVRGFTEALRLELELAGAPIGVTCVHPGGIKTNIARAARLDTSIRDIIGGEAGSEARGVAKFEKMFITTPQVAAKTILDGVRANRARVLIGPDARVIDVMQRVLPARYQALTKRMAKRSRR
jgi:NAD(P)-dependent dehydrogenase (short-subunit alcohol dehydrogenase family)